MKRFALRPAYVLALCLGVAFACLIACGDGLPGSNLSEKQLVEPKAFTEQRQLASAVSVADSLGSFAGTVVLPSEKEITLHGKMTGGMPAFIKFLEERKTGLNYIYKKYQAIKPGFEGQISLDITVDVCGDVFSIAVISSTTDFPEFDTELKNSFLRQQFPKTDQGHYTLSFSLSFGKDAPAENGVETAQSPGK